MNGLQAKHFRARFEMVSNKSPFMWNESEPPVSRHSTVELSQTNTFGIGSTVWAIDEFHFSLWNRIANAQKSTRRIELCRRIWQCIRGIVATRDTMPLINKWTNGIMSTKSIADETPETSMETAPVYVRIEKRTKIMNNGYKT